MIGRKRKGAKTESREDKTGIDSEELGKCSSCLANAFVAWRKYVGESGRGSGSYGRQDCR
ncbi:MAG: hypothetical protein Aurels2KO_54210 [Aureliella sp.]